MGQAQSISQLVDQKKGIGEFKEAFELLNIEQSMRQTLDCKKSKMYIDALNDECIPIVCAVDEFGELLVVADSETDLEATITNKLEKHLRSEYLEELTSLLKEVLISVLKAKTKYEGQQTHVVSANKSVIRIDYYLHFDQLETTKYVLLYHIQVGVVDMTKARLQVLIYELTRATDDRKLGDAGKELKERADDTIHLFDAMQTLAKAARGEKVPTNVTEGDGEEDLGEEDPE